jgi:hypothetical protein
MSALPGMLFVIVLACAVFYAGYQRARRRRVATADALITWRYWSQIVNQRSEILDDLPWIVPGQSAAPRKWFSFTPLEDHDERMTMMRGPFE